ncbi:PAS domain S-box protein [Edaphobacter sp. HDX4]|uniref:PAS domain S-box protein n=1 Tax=Edaphobacter sp. HDX4 TaxID=2794064 RepID=UPI002FE502FD
MPSPQDQKASSRPSSTDKSGDHERKLALVVEIGLRLSNSHDLQSIVQATTDAGLELSGAAFGAFFYNTVDEKGESYQLYTLSGVDRSHFASFPMPRNTDVFSPTFRGTGILRSPDITADPRYGHNAPHYGMPQGHLPVRSYLAVPVKNQAGEVLGGLLYGHEQTDVFPESSERIISALAAQAAIAIENARLREQLNRKIEDLQKAQQTQRIAAERLGELAAIVESSDDAIISKNLNGIITSWNKAASRILGYSPDEIIGKSILTLIPTHLHGDETTILSNIRAGNRIEHFETIRRTRSGEMLDVSLTVSPIRNENGKIVGASKILRDISSRKRIEHSLLQAEKIAATGRMAATIAHEINNPLEAVVNLLYLIRPTITNPEGLGYLDTAESELSRVSHIARQTLGYYRDNASATPASLTDLVEQTIEIYQPRCSSVGIEIRGNLQSSTPVVMRRGEIMQVISNLITNSIYAMSDGGTLSLTVCDTTTPDSGVLLIIADTGTGIAPEHMSKIFDAFFTTRKTIGTGIGLFIAKQFVEGHGGRITLASSTAGENSGTTATIFLPLQTTYEANR